MKLSGRNEGGEVAQLGNFFDTLAIHGLDKEGLGKRFPRVSIPNGEFDIGFHIYESFIYTRLSDVLLEGNHTEQGLDMFIEGYLGGIFVTIRGMLKSLGVTLDAETGIGISNAFAKLKEDLSEALKMYPAGTSAMQALSIYKIRASKLTE